MYRWPIRVLEPTGLPEPDGAGLLVEIPPRGAAFTLSCLLHLGHPVHLALIDAYLGGSVPFPDGASLGSDSGAVLASLVGPLVALYQHQITVAGLSDVVLLPPRTTSVGHSRFLLVRTNDEPIWLKCTSTSPLRRVGRRRIHAPSAWGEVLTGLPGHREVREQISEGTCPARVRVEIHGPRAVSGTPNADAPGLAPALRAVALGRAGRCRAASERGISALDRIAGDISYNKEPDARSHGMGLLVDAAAEAVAHGVRSARVRDPIRRQVSRSPATRRSAAVARSRPALVQADLPEFLSRADLGERVAEAMMEHDGLAIDASVSLAPGASPTLALLPDADLHTDRVVTRMLGAAWQTVETLLGITLAERRMQSISIRLLGPSRSSELAIGWSLVLPRNRRVFAAWVGTDGRVLIRLATS